MPLVRIDHSDARTNPAEISAAIHDAIVEVYGIPERDRIVPPESARAAAARLRHGLLHIAAGGHIGMVAGTGAEAALWRPLCAWLRSLA